MTDEGGSSAGLESAAPRDRGRRWDDAVTLVPGLAAVAVFGLWSRLEGGFFPTVWLPGALFLLALACALVIAEGSGRWRLRRLGLIAVAALAALTLWSFLSISWAEVRGDAWDGANRTLLYLIVFVLFVTRPWTARTAAIVLGAYVCVTTLVGVVSVAETLAAGDQGRFIQGRLIHPTGYQNANAALFMMAVWPAVVAGSRRKVHPALRALALGAAAFLVEVALLSQSRGSLFTLPVVALALLVLLPGRVRSAVALALPLGGVFLAREPLLAVYDGTQVPSDLAGAVQDAVVAMAVSVPAVIVAAAAWSLADRRLTLRPSAERRLRRAAVVVVAGAALVAAAALPALDPIERLERGWREFRGETQAAGGASYLGSGLGSNRYDLWRVGLIQFRERPVLGKGADNFAVAYLRHRRTLEEPHYAHSLEIGALGGLGVVGAALLVAFVVASFAAARPRREAGIVPRAVATAALLPAVWWIVHGSIDWFWEFPALTAPAVALLGLGAGVARAPRDQALVAGRGRRGAPVVGAALVAAAIASAASLSLPWLAARQVEIARATWRVDPVAAYDALESARSLNPLSEEADLFAGAIAARRREDERAGRAFERVLERNPRSWYAHFELGLLASVEGDAARARIHLRRAGELNPREDLIPQMLDRIGRGERIHPSSLDFVFVRRVENLAQ